MSSLPGLVGLEAPTYAKHPFPKEIFIYFRERLAFLIFISYLVVALMGTYGNYEV
jgi:hypothetical protein